MTEQTTKPTVASKVLIKGIFYAFLIYLLLAVTTCVVKEGVEIYTITTSSTTEA